jgi:DNA-binding response OmpR family regulator
VRAAEEQARTDATAADEGGLGEITATEDVFVIADEANNQVVVKAPKRLQPQFSRLIERLDLLERVYEGDADVDSNSLEVIVGRLRRKIGADRIETIRGRGYRLTCGGAGS